MVIILTKADDIHSLAVKHEIELLGEECLIIDTADFPSKLSFDNNLQDSVYYQSIIFKDESSKLIDAKKVSGVWRRRIYNHIIPESITDISYKEISFRDTKDALQGFFLNLCANGCKMINNPINETAALNKIYQLNMAQKASISIPKTIITSNPNSVRVFFTDLQRRGKQVVYKAFNSPKDGLISTTFLTETDFDRIEDLNYAPTIFQEYIEGRDLRVTYVNGKLFAAEILVSIPEAKRDWRLEIFNDVITYKLSHSQETKILTLMDELKLEYGAIDLKLNTQNEIIFLEVNPWGQYLFVEIQTGLQISRCIAQTLI